MVGASDATRGVLAPDHTGPVAEPLTVTGDEVRPSGLFMFSMQLPR